VSSTTCPPIDRLTSSRRNLFSSPTWFGETQWARQLCPRVVSQELFGKSGGTRVDPVPIFSTLRVFPRAISSVYPQSVRFLFILLGVLWQLGAADLCGSIRTLVAAESKRQDIPGISIAVVRNNHVVCSIAQGWADIEQRIPNTAKSRHRLASLSKPITAVLTMKLAEEGKIALGDSTRRLLPALPPQYDAVTINRLLSHQSGIREYSDMAEVFSTRHYSNLEEAARAIFVESPLLFEPGAKTAYTTYGYTLLGAALERATGQSFKQILEARLPDFSLDDFVALTPSRVRPYRKSSSTRWENAPAFDASNKYPGGGIVSSAVDYANFLIQVSAGKLLRKESVAAMWTRQSLSDGSPVAFATLGWATGVRGIHRYYTHGGLQPGTTTVMHWFPDLGSGSVILSNAEGPELDGLQESILEIVVGRKPE
jgi:serine beta-lactamase-like protein LACTB, mitochondrial